MELYKDAAYYFKQISEAAPYKTVAVWTLTWMICEIGSKKTKTC